MLCPLPGCVSYYSAPPAGTLHLGHSSEQEGTVQSHLGAGKCPSPPQIYPNASFVVVAVMFPKLTCLIQTIFNQMASLASDEDGCASAPGSMEVSVGVEVPGLWLCLAGSPAGSCFSGVRGCVVAFQVDEVFKFNFKKWISIGFGTGRRACTNSVLGNLSKFFFVI